MKKLYFLLLAFSFFTTANSQIVNIPDARFKEMLFSVNTPSQVAKNLNGVDIEIDANNDGQIQESEASNVSYLDVSNVSVGFLDIYDLSGIQSFINLKTLNCAGNKLSSLSVSSFVKLISLDCSSNELTSLSVSSLVNLTYLNCSYNQFSSLAVSSLVKLTSLDCSLNSLSTLSVSSLVNLTSLNCSFNQLSTLAVSSLVKLTSLNCSENNLISLNVSSLINLTSLNCNYNEISSLDVSSLLKLTKLYCTFNQLSTLPVSSLVKLTGLYCSSNPLSSLDVSSLINLNRLNCYGIGLRYLDVSSLVKLNSLDCSSNQLTTLDLSKLSSLSSLDFKNNKSLESLYIKNGNFDNIDWAKMFIYNYIPNLKYICADEFEVDNISYKMFYWNFKNCQVNSYCSFVPGGAFYTIQGNQKLDSNNNGCDVNDIVMPNLKYSITDGIETGSIISKVSGNYTIPVSAGTHTINPVFENPTYFTVSPTTVNITFPTQTSPFTQNFCITPKGVRPDLEITLLPLQPARPGFDAKYKLVYKNKGNTIQSGTVNLGFTDSVLDLVVANPLASTQTANNLSWNFTSLQPFETREITFKMKVNSPMEVPAVINGDILNFGTTITSSATDETPTDNTFTFNQTVVGSYDPNDKTCLEGSVITPNLIGQYVHYTIRFENTGTFAAENVVVKDMIDLTKFDISTLVPTSASHSYTTRISDGNKVEFIFENINLPFDDANNDGYIAFKIKTKPTLVVNDSFSNEASIFFDYNFPIVTNKATSTFKTLGTQDFDFDRYFTVYPNPATTVLNMTTKESINTESMQVYNTLGQLVLAIPNAEKVSNVDVSNLKSGNYFIQIKTDKGSSSSKFVKE